MSDSIKHECGIAMIRLLKPVDFYLKKYGSALYGLNKMHLLMEKQHNRGQDGAGLANIKLYPEPGCVYIDRERSNTATPIKDVFQRIESRIAEATAKNPERLRDAQWLKRHVGFTGEVFLGHLRYGTFGKNNIENVHPVSRENNWMTRSLVLAGNFNLTNIDELFRRLIELGQYPPATTDTVTILERIGHFLDRENDDKYRYFKDKGYSKQQITDLLAKHIDLKEVVSLAARRWDGGYVMAGMIGHGDAFVMRDPCGIRPAFYYRDDEVVVAASERAVIQTVFNKPYEQVRELEPGHVLIVRRDGDFSVEPFTAPQPIRPCSFERIYFSRGSDRDIYRERKRLGALLVPQILRSIDHDIENTVFSYIPNTAESAFFGLVGGLDEYCQHIRAERILRENGSLTEQRLKEILRFKPRFEKVAIKDVKMRTFITQDNDRDDLVAHVYDITYGTIRAGKDNPRRFDRAGHDAAAEHRPDTRPARAAQDRRLLVGPADPLSGLLRDRHVATGRLRRLPGRCRTAARKRTADAHRRRLPRMSRAVARRAKPSRELRQTNLRAVHRRADFGQDRADRQGAGYPLAGRSNLPDRAEHARGDPRARGRLVLHRRLPYPGRQRGRRSGVRQLLRETQRKSILNQDGRPGPSERHGGERNPVPVSTTNTL